MEKQYRLLILSIIILFTISLASAVSISSQSSVNTNENFNLLVSGSSFYALELNIPESIQIVSDPSGGDRIGELYKSVSTGSFNIIMKGILAGNYTISGRYTEGDGVNNLNNLLITIKNKEVQQVCPICPSSTPWSNCENGQQIRYTYLCSESTNYFCVQSIEYNSCSTISSSSSSSGSSTSTKTCDIGWICNDKSTLVYRSSDCSLSSFHTCENGCENGNCVIKQSDIPKDNLSVEILPDPTQKINSFSIFDYWWILAIIFIIIISLFIIKKTKK